MATRSIRAVSAAQKQIAENLNLARRQQKITVELLAARTGLSAPTVSRMINKGEGSLENFLRISAVLQLLNNVTEATNPLNTPIGEALAFEQVPQRVRYQ